MNIYSEQTTKIIKEETPFPEISYDEARKNIGKHVKKQSGLLKDGVNRKASKPFKSGFTTNTIKDVIEHPIKKVPAYIFNEDDSYVECRICITIN